MARYLPQWIRGSVIELMPHKDESHRHSCSIPGRNALLTYLLACLPACIFSYLLACLVSHKDESHIHSYSIPGLNALIGWLASHKDLPITHSQLPGRNALVSVK